VLSGCASLGTAALRRAAPVPAAVIAVAVVATSTAIGCTYLGVQHKTRGDRGSSFAVIELGQGASAKLEIRGTCDAGGGPDAGPDGG
jgi:hypothetical protein